MPLLADAYVPETTDANRAAIVLVHGGSWSGGTRMSFGAEAEWLAQLGFVTFTIDYRLAPQFPYPAGVADVRRFVRWLRAPAQVARFRIDPAARRCVRLVGGRSSRRDARHGRERPAHQGIARAGRRVVVGADGPHRRARGDRRRGGAHVPRVRAGCHTGVRREGGGRVAGASRRPVRRAHVALQLGSGDRAVDPGRDDGRRLEQRGVEHALVVYPGDAHGGSFRVEAWPQTVAFFEHHLGAPRAG